LSNEALDSFSEVGLTFVETKVGDWVCHLLFLVSGCRFCHHVPRTVIAGGWVGGWIGGGGGSFLHVRSSNSGFQVVVSSCSRAKEVGRRSACHSPRTFGMSRSNTTTSVTQFWGKSHFTSLNFS
jgi:hypothetical protein